MKNLIKSIVIPICIIFLLSSCSILDQSKEMKTFAKCMFRLDGVQDVMLAGVDIQDVESFTDLSFSEASKLSMAAMSGKLPLGFTVNVEVKNPNSEQARMNDFFWTLFIDDVEITQGKVGHTVKVPPNGGTAIMPIDVQVDLYKILSGESADAILNFGMNLAGAGGAPSRIKLKAKPTIHIGMNSIKYPGYFIIEEEFVSE